MTPQRNPKHLQAKSRAHAVHPIGGQHYEVTSGESGAKYTVALLPNGGATCTCDWAKYRPTANAGKCGCSHVVAAYNWQAQFDGATSVSAWAGQESAERQHRPTLDIGDGLVLTVRRT